MLLPLRRPRSGSRSAGFVAVVLGALMGACSQQGPGASVLPAMVQSAPGPVAVTPAAMARSRPLRVTIPAIDVSSRLMDLGLRSDGTMQVPPSGFPAGWYTGGPTPGEIGPAVIVGHVDWAGRAGVFHELRLLTPGDLVTVSRADGTLARFRITRVRKFAKDAFPTELVYGNLDRAGLRLITCGGPFDRRSASYRDNVIAFGELQIDLSAPGPSRSLR